MDFNSNEPNYNENQATNTNYYKSTDKNGLAIASLVLGILAIVSVCCVYGSYIFGSIAITLGLLSRGNKKKMETNALIGTILSTVGMAISTIIIIISIISVIIRFGSFDNFLEEYESFYEETYGITFPDIDSSSPDKEENPSYDDNSNDNSPTYDYDYNYDSAPSIYDYFYDNYPFDYYELPDEDYKDEGPKKLNTPLN